MPTIRIQIAYDGTAYHGWQVQSRHRSVEGELTRALTRILDADTPVKVQGASRTDSGVHARGQVAHFRYRKDRTIWDFCRGLNGLTDDDICVVRVEEASHDFHARHSARGKIYRYRIWNHTFVHPFDRHRSWHIKGRLDLRRMRHAARQFVGEHDFAGFRSSNCSSPTTIRRMERVEISGGDGPVVEVLVKGEAFLQHMVRIMVGTIVEIGLGRLPADRVQHVLEQKDRRQAGRTAPACGLTLDEVFYPGFDWKGSEPTIGGAYSAEASSVFSYTP